MPACGIIKIQYDDRLDCAEGEKMRRITLFFAVIASAAILCGCESPEPERTAKKEIVVVCGRDATGTVDKIMKNFTTNSKTTEVKLIEFSKESADVYQVTASMLADEDIQIDAMLIEDVYAKGLMNNYLLPLCEIKDFPLSSMPKGVEKFLGDERNVYWYPLILDTGIIYYRKDMADGTASLTEFSQGRDGPYAIQGTDGEEMLCCALEFINLTGSIKDGLIAYKQALENSADNRGDYMTEFIEGNAIYMRSWASDRQNISEGFLPGGNNVGTQLMTDDKGKSYGISKSYGYAINKATDKAENCRELLDYLKSDEVQSEILMGMKTLPIRRDDYKKPMILDINTYNSNFFEIFDYLSFRPARADYAHASREARRAVADYLRDEGTIDAAAAAITELLNE